MLDAHVTSWFKFSGPFPNSLLIDREDSLTDWCSVSWATESTCYSYLTHCTTCSADTWVPTRYRLAQHRIFDPGPQTRIWTAPDGTAGKSVSKPLFLRSCTQPGRVHVDVLITAIRRRIEMVFGKTAHVHLFVTEAERTHLSKTWLLQWAWLETRVRPDVDAYHRCRKRDPDVCHPCDASGKTKVFYDRPPIDFGRLSIDEIHRVCLVHFSRVYFSVSTDLLHGFYRAYRKGIWVRYRFWLSNALLAGFVAWCSYGIG